MANISGQITLDSIRLLDVDTDPSISGGTPAGLGDIAVDDSGRIYINRDGTATNWKRIMQQSAASSFTAGSIPFSDSNGDLAEANSQLFWDNVNGSLGLGITAPQSKIHAAGGAGTVSARFTNTATGNASTDGFRLGIDASGNAEVRQAENLPLSFYTNDTLQLQLTAGGLGVFTNAIRVGNTADTTNGNIRYDGTDLYGRVLNLWLSLTSIPSYYASTTTPITTTSTTPTQLTGSSITPAAGTYIGRFSCETQNTNNGRQHTFAIRVGGTAVAESVRNKFMSAGGNRPTEVSTLARFTVNGSQAVDISWFVSNNQGQVNAYTFTIERAQAL